MQRTNPLGSRRVTSGSDKSTLELSNYRRVVRHTASQSKPLRSNSLKEKCRGSRTCKPNSSDCIANKQLI